MQEDLVRRFDGYEDELIRRFHRHPFFATFERLGNEELIRYLTQKWFLSQHFVEWYDRAIVGLRDGEAAEVLKQIVFDETPHDAPSHREDLLADLEFIGLHKLVILNTRPTSETSKAKERLDRLVGNYADPDYDLKAMAALRIAGEVLVAEEYRHVVPELEKRFGLTPEKSRFYAPHFYHDRKDAETGTHARSFEPLLGRMMADEGKIAIATQSAEDAYEARMSFYDQFTASHKMLKAGKRLGAAAAAATLLYFSSHTPYTEHERYARFLASLSPEAKVFYLETERWLLDRFKETSDTRYLKNIGTFQAVCDVWGPDC